MPVDSAFANGFGGAPVVGLLGGWPPAPAPSFRQGLLPTEPTPQPTLGVLGIPGDPASLFDPPFDPYQLAGAGPQPGGDLALMALQSRALQAVRDHFGAASNWLVPPLGQGLTPDSGGSPAPAIQPPPQSATAVGAGVTAAPTVAPGTLQAFDPGAQLSLDPSYTVQPGENLSSIAGRYVASGLYQDVTTGVGALARGNSLSTSGIRPGQALFVPTAAPGDARLGRAMDAADARMAAARALQDRSRVPATNGNSAFIPGVPVRRANEPWPTLNHLDSLYVPRPADSSSGDIGFNPTAKASQNLLATAGHLLGEAFAPEVNAYEYGVVQPLWNGLSALANSPLGDPGTYATIQSMGPAGAIAGGGLGLAAKGLDRVAELGADAEAAEAEAEGIQLIGGRAPPNSKYAGQIYPLENLSPELQEKYPNSVRFTNKGFPDFSPYAIREVKPPIVTGVRWIDRPVANRMSALERNPKDYSWHHDANTKTTLQLVPTDIHSAVAHWGEVAVIKHGG